MSNIDANKNKSEHRWTFLSNHAHVLVCIARNPDIRSRDVAQMVGITERRVFKIISDLEANNILVRHKEGRRNHYQIKRSEHLRHPLEENTSIGHLLDTLMGAL